MNSWLTLLPVEAQGHVDMMNEIITNKSIYIPYIGPRVGQKEGMDDRFRFSFMNRFFTPLAVANYRG